ncbi:unnamed protein product [Chilo suppressalis]|uniref:DDB1- and CUL4-associated factor 8 n=1 Tax=Chilo suppressalis TaxID=168631 RepID=A0ABN8BAG9_CHISP|nr:hypothetical protein evm_000492 [Chilo suppressalis]CAH0406790.1 unnamed protein product [Chilo suppressalis]
MEDNTSSDDDVKDSPLSPKLGGKKFKLNDGSSQDSLTETVATTSKVKKEENVDSGVSADKSESTSSDDRVRGANEGPSNEVVNVAPSSSNVREILLNIRRPRRSRNYRKRKTPDRDSDSGDSSRDSDDLSPEESTVDMRPETSNSECDSSDDQAFVPNFSDPSPESGSSSSGSNDSYDDDLVDMHSVDTDSEDEDVWSRTRENVENEEFQGEPPRALLKVRPKHNYFMLREIINREMGLTFPCSKTSKSNLMFEQKFYGSLHVVYRMDKMFQLNQHKGCVNSINFHPEGHLLASGSDDQNVIIWDWAHNKALQTIKTGHRSNVFQSKFLHLNAKSQLNIVTCARDGQIRLIQCPASGGAPVVRRKLAAHARAAHKLHVSPHEPHLVTSAGEDGLCLQCDVRADQVTRLFHVKERGVTIPLYSVCGHPLDSWELVLAGRDKFVRVYDRRKSTKPIALYCPGAFQDHGGCQKKKLRQSMMHLTCAVYNHDGSEILGSYNDDDIYLFDAKNDVYDKDNTKIVSEGYKYRYSGHRNSATFKGVSFFGPKSEYIVSGSDCSYIYIWERKSEAIVQWMQGDVGGVVNCIETHPRFPVLATSGLDKDVKIWTARSDSDPDFAGMERVVRENSASQFRSPLFNDFLPTLYSAWRADRRDSGPHNNLELDGNVCTAF